LQYNAKMSYNIIDTKSYNIFNDETIKQIKDILTACTGYTTAFTASCFDLLHPGHVLMLEDAKRQADILIVALHTDPTINRSSKNKPVQTFEERKIMINAIKHVDFVIEYATESDLYNILLWLNPNVRVLGSDWQGKEYTGHKLQIPVYFHKRDHDWSTSGLRKRVAEAEH
jgi:glycerol-3-phosphate cytidylyltransferase